MATSMAAQRSPFSLTAQRSPLAVPPVPGSRPDHRNLSHWMSRALEELASLRSASDPDTVHDLRVAIRRCRSLAAVMEEVDPDPAWPEMRKVARKLFRGLGALRDTQVTKGWIKSLAPEGDTLQAQLLSSLDAEEKQETEAALRIAEKFSEKDWAHLERHLKQRARLVPVGSLAAECLALERYEEAKELHNRALRTEKSKPWHTLRIGLKRFRYTVESLLPDHYALWGDQLKRVQDLLGDIHDLDVLAELLEETKSPETEQSTQVWQEKISQERLERLETYRQLTLGKTSLWHEWRHNLPHGERLEAAAAARLHATARAADAHPRRTNQVSRIAVRLFHLLHRAGAAHAFKDPGMRRIMQSAAKLHGVSSQGDHYPTPKQARKFLKSLPVPPNWTSDQWDLMAWVVRYHRGPEPKQKNGFAKLSEAQQTAVRALSGVLRLSRALRKCGIETTRGLGLENSADAMVFRVPGIPDTAEAAARLAAAKHLLESTLKKPLILKAVPKPEASCIASEPSPEPAPNPVTTPT
ncbi:MAG: CHAD domain-containing protein [Candidatus Acidiferrum sp.]